MDHILRLFIMPWFSSHFQCQLIIFQKEIFKLQVGNHNFLEQINSISGSSYHWKSIIFWLTVSVLFLVYRNSSLHSLSYTPFPHPPPLFRGCGEFLNDDWNSLPFSTSLLASDSSMWLFPWYTSQSTGELFTLNHLKMGGNYLNRLIFLYFNCCHK